MAPIVASAGKLAPHGLAGKDESCRRLPCLVSGEYNEAGAKVQCANERDSKFLVIIN